MSITAMPTALVVESVRARREDLGDWLERAGFDVVACPGPVGADWTCVGGRGERCPLAVAADLVVLDLELGSDIAMTGTPAWQLLIYYMELGKKVVALVGEEDPVHPFGDEQVAVVRRPVERRTFLDAVRTLTHPVPARR